MIIQPSFGGCLHLRIAIPIDKTAIFWYLPTCGASQKTAEERFNMFARGWLAYPVTQVAHATTAEERL